MYKPRCCGISDRGLWITENIFKGGEPLMRMVRVNSLIAAQVDWIKAGDRSVYGNVIIIHNKMLIHYTLQNKALFKKKTSFMTNFKKFQVV